MDYRVCKWRTDFNACSCTRRCRDIVRESALGKNPLPHRGIEPPSAACRSDTLPIKLTSPPRNRSLSSYATVTLFVIEFEFPKRRSCASSLFTSEEQEEVGSLPASHGGDVPIYVWHKPAELAHSFLLCSCVYFCLYDLFNCISFHKFSRQLSVFSLGSCGLSSAFLVLSTTYLFIKVFCSPNIIPSGWFGSKHHLTDYHSCRPSLWRHIEAWLPDTKLMAARVFATSERRFAANLTIYRLE